MNTEVCVVCLKAVSPPSIQQCDGCDRIYCSDKCFDIDTNHDCSDSDEHDSVEPK